MHEGVWELFVWQAHLQSVPASHCRAHFHPSLALTSSVSGSLSSSLDRRDDPDASSHPTRHVTCFRRAQDAFWAPCHVLIQKITSENTFHSQHSLRVCQISFSPDAWSGPSPSAMFLQYVLPVPSEINHLNDDNMMQYCSPSSWTEWVLRAPD